MTDPTDYAREMVDVQRRVGERIRQESTKAIESFSTTAPERMSYHAGQVHAYGVVLDIIQQENESFLALLKSEENGR